MTSFTYLVSASISNFLSLTHIDWLTAVDKKSRKKITSKVIDQHKNLHYFSFVNIWGLYLIDDTITYLCAKFGQIDGVELVPLGREQNDVNKHNQLIDN